MSFFTTLDHHCPTPYHVHLHTCSKVHHIFPQSMTLPLDSLSSLSSSAWQCHIVIFFDCWWTKKSMAMKTCSLFDEVWCLHGSVCSYNNLAIIGSHLPDYDNDNFCVRVSKFCIYQSHITQSFHDLGLHSSNP